MIKKLLAVNVPIKNCNLNCQYCYISALNQSQKGPAVFHYSPEHVRKCLSKERLGDPCIINLTGGGETLIPKEMPRYIYELLDEGHYLEVVTNGTLTQRFKEIATFPKELLEHLEFKFSFHYAELKRLNFLDQYFDNVNMMSKAGCSFTVELMPNDSLVDEIPEILKVCKEKIGAPCQLTVGRNDLTNGRDILTSYPREKYEKIWSCFDSTMFKFKLEIFGKKITDFCYAGAWSLYLDLGTGDAKPCYGQMCNQNLFKDPSNPIKWEPVGRHCRQPYCYNGHAFLTLGDVPTMDTPTYADIRNRRREDGSEWLKPELKEAFSSKLGTTNDIWSEKEEKKYEFGYPFRFVTTAFNDIPEIYNKVIKKNKKK